MNIKDVKVTVTMATTWERAKIAALRTSGKKMVNLPDEAWERKMLASEHAPIRMVEYDILIENIPQWVTVHLVRHHIGVQPFVATQRTDRNPNIKCDRDDLPQGELNSMQFTCNAQALINISKLRLCRCASFETRSVWEKVREAIADVDPIMAEFMVPSCVYRNVCPEPNGCGFASTATFDRQRLSYIRAFRPNTSK